ncbi:MAG: hypothetical protein IPP29_06985 [Bacteroidetes bacterium]|nr:hypothetical protein [Bacteroidota bacterium]
MQYNGNTTTWHENIFYDFNMLPGDTLSPYMTNFTIIADSTSNILLSNGQMHHAIYYHDTSEPWVASVLIEGIGACMVSSLAYLNLHGLAHLHGLN